ncbi:MAG TPA: DUF4126 family protein [Ktedonobacterales bacterium]|nr:DUF4126 family protein [Ktedonobacterales bacterium]
MFFADTTSLFNSALSPTAITVLLAALGLSSTAGLRAYLPLLAIGVAGNVPGPFDGKLIPLQGNFALLSNPLVLIVLAALTVGEFTVDKIPVVDHLSDAVHTFIRPLAGAMIMAGTANSLSDTSQWGAAILGGVLALAFHGVKASTRPAVTATTAGLGNPIVSLIEDVVAVVAVAALVLAPIVGIILMVLLVLVFGRLLARIVRRFRGRKAGGQAQQAVVNAAPRRGRGGRGRAAPQLPAPAPVGAVTPISSAAPITPAPTGPAAPTATTLAGTFQPLPYVPPLPAYPSNASAPALGMPPQPTQTMPGYTPPGLAPGDATTMPGSYQGSNP